MHAVKSPRFSSLSSLIVATLALLTPAAFASELATATITNTQPTPGVYDYTITLNNTGTSTIGTYWFSWIPGAAFLTTVPSLVNSPAGWTEKTTNAGLAIQWTTTTNLLAPGATLTGFEFLSTETPAQLNSLVGSTKGTEPATVSFIYVAAPLATGDPGYQFTTALSPAITPEPPASLLTLTGLLGLAAFISRRRLRRSASASIA